MPAVFHPICRQNQLLYITANMEFLFLSKAVDSFPLLHCVPAPAPFDSSTVPVLRKFRLSPIVCRTILCSAVILFPKVPDFSAQIHHLPIRGYSNNRFPLYTSQFPLPFPAIDLTADAAPHSPFPNDIPILLSPVLLHETDFHIEGLLVPLCSFLPDRNPIPAKIYCIFPDNPFLLPASFFQDGPLSYNPLIILNEPEKNTALLSALSALSS